MKLTRVTMFLMLSVLTSSCICSSTSRKIDKRTQETAEGTVTEEGVEEHKSERILDPSRISSLGIQTTYGR